MRLNKYNKATKPATDDYLVIDGDTNGTRALPAGAYSGKSSTVAATINGSDWTGTEPFWENKVYVTGITTDNNVEILLAPTATVDDVKECQKAQISVGSQSTGYVTLKSASDSKPTADIPIVVIIRGD